MGKEKQINTIKKMIQIGNKLGLSQIGIAGIFASIWEDGEELKNFTDVPITTGKNLIAALVKEYISRCRRVLEKGDNGTLGVIGYGRNRLSGIFLDTFNAEFGEVLLDGEDQKSREIPNARRETTENIFKKSDMIILTVMGLGLNNYIDMVRPGSVICDLIVPFYLSKEISKTRKDLLAFEGVWSRYAKMEQYVGRNKKRLFKNNIVPACVAELIILSLENKFGEYSLADNINHRNALDMLEMSKRNGFDFFGFKQGMNIYSREDLERIKNASKG